MKPNGTNVTRTEEPIHGAEETTERTPRALTYDESKAAEAAFQGLPFNPDWSDAARKVYDGILFAMGERQLAAMGDAELETQFASQ